MHLTQSTWQNACLRIKCHSPASPLPLLPHLPSQQHSGQNHNWPPNQPKVEDTDIIFPPYLTQDIFDVDSTQFIPLGIHVIHDVPVFCCNAVVPLLVTAAKVFIGRAEFQRQRWLERQPIIQTLRMSQQSACQAQGEANTHMWARKRNSRAAAALCSLWPSIHFLQQRFLQVRCIEILDFFVAWFIHLLCFIHR